MMNHRNVELISALAELSKTYPHWRMGQLISNVAGWADQDIWELEDHEMLIAIQSHLDMKTSRETVSALSSTLQHAE